MKNLWVWVGCLFLSSVTVAMAGPKNLSEAKELLRLIEINSETYSEGNGSYSVQDTNLNLPSSHTRHCEPTKVSSAANWVRKEFASMVGGEDLEGKAITQKRIDAAITEFKSLLGKGAIERCFSKEKDVDDEEGKKRNWTSYVNRATGYQILFVILPCNV